MTDFGWSLENKDIVFTMAGGGCEEKEVGYSGLGRSSVKTDEITIALPFIHTTQWIQSFFNHCASTALAIGARLLLKYPFTTFVKAKS